jgi:hypothetical protein
MSDYAIAFEKQKISRACLRASSWDTADACGLRELG